MNQHSDQTYHDPFDPQALLKWYLEMGVDECIGDESVDRYALSAEMIAKRQMAPQGQPAAQGGMRAGQVAPALPPKDQVKATDEMVHQAVELAAKSKSLEELQEAVRHFEGCALKKTAMNTVFGEGNPAAGIMLIGEAPEAEEDRAGRPMVGPAGQLLDKMLHACGLEPELGKRDHVYISNVLYWRPPGNRPATPSEIAVCLPFVERQIELVDPKVIILLGGAAAKAVLGHHEGVSRLRGKWFTHSTPGLQRPAQTTVLFHPAYLLRSPAQKRKAWGDLLKAVEKLESI